MDRREKAKTLEDFDIAKGKTIVGMQAFKSSCEVLIKLSSDKGISFTYMRMELAKIKVKHKDLRAKKNRASKPSS